MKISPTTIAIKPGLFCEIHSEFIGNPGGNADQIIAVVLQ
jgi:hypothetical protein